MLVYGKCECFVMQMLYVCVHHVAVLNATESHTDMTFSLLMLVEDARCDHILWMAMHGLSNRALPPTLNTSITFNNKITTTPKHIGNYFNKQFTNTVKHATHKTNRSMNRATHKIQ